MEVRYQVQLYFVDGWYDIGPTYRTRADAEWVVAKWKQFNQCMSDHSWRVVAVEVGDNP